ncbi:MAG: hypothetical protein FWG38_04880 [Defluviitaleaceae bacterium]|nr:hypothetical protein [Defluviitaleaceae bacterium]
MRPFLILIAELLFVAILQTIVEAILDTETRQKQLRVVNIACIVASYALLFRYIQQHLWHELTAFVLLW